ncbi:MAG: hypothetical protein HZA36_03675 [Parcubacteria group bacterium]|nr:hypothetical protein [Parcubacteria group bacterium]
MKETLMCLCTDHQNHPESHHCTMGGLARNLGVFMRNTYIVEQMMNPAVTPESYLNQRFDTMIDILIHLRCKKSIIKDLETKRKSIIEKAVTHITTQIPFAPVLFLAFDDKQLQHEFDINRQELMSLAAFSHTNVEQEPYILYGVEIKTERQPNTPHLLTLGECLSLCLFYKGRYEFPFLYQKQNKPEPPFVIKRIHSYGPTDKLIHWYPICASRT